jgi:hypothetical protein
MFGEERRQPCSVAEHLLPEIVQVRSMVMPNDASRLITDGIPGEKDTKKGIEIFASSRQGTGAESLVEPP